MFFLEQVLIGIDLVVFPTKSVFQSEPHKTLNGVRARFSQKSYKHLHAHPEAIGPSPLRHPQQLIPHRHACFVSIHVYSPCREKSEPVIGILAAERLPSSPPVTTHVGQGTQKKAKLLSSCVRPSGGKTNSAWQLQQTLQIFRTESD